jgi:hypothetical protein
MNPAAVGLVWPEVDSLLSGPPWYKNGEEGHRSRNGGIPHVLRIGCGRGLLRAAAAHAGSP